MCAWPSSSARTKNWGTEILTDADLEAQLDILHSYFNDSLNASTGHAHTGTTADGPKITLTTGVQGTLPAANGGTGLTSLTSLYALIYPIGTVLTFGVSTNPNTLFGFGTWTAIAGRVIVGIDAGQTEFDTLNETGGAKTHTLTIPEIPAHTHTYSLSGAAGSGTSGGDQGSGGTTGSTGGGGAHNNLQPYIVKYIWERTA